METAFLDWLRPRLPAHPRLRLGAGDDAALLRLAAGADCVVTTDLLTDGVDFRLADVEAARIGRKALAVNLSDLAAMAARPVAAVVALALPRRGALELAQRLYEGLLPLADQYGLSIAGGDTNTWDGGLVVAVTAIGETTARGPLLRSGGRAGDLLVVTGAVGGSLLGRHLDFQPRVREALLLHEQYELHAGIDISDGLAIDLGRLADASGCGAELWTAEVPIHPDAVRLVRERPDGRTPLDHALADGEDFELLLAVPEAEARRMAADVGIGKLAWPLATIGRLLAAPGLWRVDADGARRPLERLGWEHQETDAS
jgi:thiamine-monophosphate kinase